MELLKQCQKWNENKEYQKLIDALENIPAEERTPEIDSELAKAYIAIADIGEREPYEEGSALPRFCLLYTSMKRRLNTMPSKNEKTAASKTIMKKSVTEIKKNLFTK